MRRALASRDLAAVFRRLQSAGVSQRRIASMTGQAPSEVYEILKGRQVIAYDVLTRIADGLGVPRGYLGLAFDESTRLVLGAMAPTMSRREGEQEEVRRLLTYAAEVTVGAVEGDGVRWWQPVELDTTPLPGRIGTSDVEQIEQVTEILRTVDHRHGGGACRDAIVGQVRRTQQLLGARYGNRVRRRLHRALADLHNLAGWTSFDVGLHSTARRHFARSLVQARSAEDPSLMANVLYRMGRLHLHRDLHREALRFFQLGQIAAQDAGCGITVAMLCANEAWALALLGEDAQAMRSIGRAQDEFARAERGRAPGWVRFFCASDLHALTGMVHAALPEPTDTRITAAIDELTASLALREHAMARSRVFELTALATMFVRASDPVGALRAGIQAAELAEEIRSIRTIDRLRPLHDEVQRWPKPNDDLSALAAKISALRPA
nr:helix-turn-helix transcriptional regulator [Micromonospora sp. DSM 115978]